jgi:hypothetical protein
MFNLWLDIFLAAYARLLQGSAGDAQDGHRHGPEARTNDIRRSSR